MTLRIERRRPAFASELLVRVGLAWAMVCALLLVTNLSGIFASGDFAPADRSTIADLPRVGLILALAPLLDAQLAEHVAAVTIPLVALGAALLLAGRIAWRVIGDEAAGFACLAMAFSMPVVLAMRPVEIDGLGWHVVLALVAMNGLMARSPRTGGWIAGSALAAWLSISIAAAPLAAAFLALSGIRWMFARHEAPLFVHTVLSLAVVSALLFAATRGSPLSGLCMGIAPAHLAAFGLCALLAIGLSVLEPLPRPALIGGLAFAAAAGGAIVLAAAPQCAASGPLGNSQPFWQMSPSLALQLLVPPAIGLVACLQLAGRSGAWLRRFWLEYAVLLGAALFLSLLLSGWGAVAGALAAVPLGWMISAWIRAARTMRRPSRRAFALGGMAVALVPAVPLALISAALPA